jgi:hypothetical protein
MGRRAWSAVLTGGLLLAGCGSAVTPAGSRPTTPEAWQQQILRDAEAVHALSAELLVEVVGPGTEGPESARILARGHRLREDVLMADGREMTLIAAPGAVYTYVSGDVFYGQESALSPDDTGLTWLANGFAGFLRGIRFTSVKLQAGQLTATWTGMLPDQEPATGQLTYSLRNHMPTGLSARIPADDTVVRVSVRSYDPAPKFTAASFRFTPLPGTLPVNAASTVVAALQSAVQGVAYPVQVPTAKSGLVLNQVSLVNSSTYGTEVLMELTGPDGTPVLLTEYAGHAKPPLPAGASTATLGGRMVTEAQLAQGLAVVWTGSGTTVLAEGNVANVVSLLDNLTPVNKNGVVP